MKTLVEKIIEMDMDITENIHREYERLVKSGTIKDTEHDGYANAKIIISVALSNISEKWYPYSDDYIKIWNNLKKF